MLGSTAEDQLLTYTGTSRGLIGFLYKMAKGECRMIE